jgi:hypothetical protein
MAAKSISHPAVRTSESGNPVDAMMARPVMMIAGAGPGMGRAVAVMAAQRGYDLTLIARRAPILEMSPS